MVAVQDRSAPGDLALVESFCNTLDERSFRTHGSAHQPHDDLNSTTALAGWLQAVNLLPGREQMSESSLRVARELRAAFRDDAARHVADRGRPSRLQPARPQVGGSALAGVALHAALTPAGFELVPAADGPVGVLGQLVVIAVRATIEGTWARLRMCAAPDCRWVYYDRSRNGAARWCSMATCGNRVKTRRYRQ